jgi:ribosome-binding factor A
MSQDKRLLRLAEQFKREIYEILRRDVQDPRVGSPTITSVRVTPDLWLARVFVRLPGDEEAQARALEGLTAAAPFVRKRLGRTLRLRSGPSGDAWEWCRRSGRGRERVRLRRVRR